MLLSFRSTTELSTDKRSMGIRENMSDTVKPRDVPTLLKYYPKPVEEGTPPPIAIHLATQLGDHVVKEAVVHDIRGTENQYSLDKTGFQVFKHASVEKNFLDDETIKEIYYPETEALFRKVTGASKVVVYHHTIRRQAHDYLFTFSTTAKKNDRAPTDGIMKSIPSSLRGPLHSVHVDQSYGGAAMVLHQHLPPSEAEILIKRRYQILIAWRPIKTILRDPFAVCDARSVREDELCPIKIIYPGRESETFAVRPPHPSRTDEGHKWCYLHKQTPEEVLMFKIFDSRTDVARRVPHSAFPDNEYEKEAARESIEVRALVFYDD